MINGGKEERKVRDAAVKRFLEAVNNYRKQTLDLTDLRGAYNPPPKYSLEEALRWEKEVEQLRNGLQEE